MHVKKTMPKSLNNNNNNKENKFKIKKKLIIYKMNKEKNFKRALYSVASIY